MKIRLKASTWHCFFGFAVFITSAGVSAQDTVRSRLAGGSSREGRLEIYHNGELGTVCDENFDNVDALVACRSLGFGSGRFIGTAASSGYGAGSGKIWLTNVRCVGQEFSLQECKRNDWEDHNCTHEQDVAISCSNHSATAAYRTTRTTRTTTTTKSRTTSNSGNLVGFVIWILVFVIALSLPVCCCICACARQEKCCRRTARTTRADNGRSDVDRRDHQNDGFTGDFEPPSYQTATTAPPRTSELILTPAVTPLADQMTLPPDYEAYTSSTPDSPFPPSYDEATKNQRPHDIFTIEER